MSSPDFCLCPSVCPAPTEGVPEPGSAEVLGQSFVNSESLMHALISLPEITTASCFTSKRLCLLFFYFAKESEMTRGSMGMEVL